MNKSKLLTGALVIVLVLLAGGSWLLFGDSVGLADYANANKYTIGDTEITSAVEKLDINWISGQVNIEYHAGSGIRLSETANRDISEDEKFRWWLDGTTLRIQFAKPQLLSFNNLQKTLTVSLPEGIVFKDVDINTTSADISVPDMTADEIEFDSTSGNVKAEISTRKLDASSTSGDLNIKQKGEIKTAAFSSTSGTVAFTGTSADKISVEATSGDIFVTLSGTVDNIDLDSTSGTIHPDLANVNKAKLSSTSGGVNGTLATFKEVKIDVTSGDVVLKLPETKGFTLHMDSISKKLRTSLPMAVKDEDKYVFGDGSATLRIDVTSGKVQIDK